MELYKIKGTRNNSLNYIETINQLGFTDKYVNFEFDGFPKEGIIELRATRKFKNKDINVSFRTFKDPNGVRYGIPQAVNEKGEIIWKRIILGDVRVFDLSNVADREEWICISMFHKVKGSPLYKPSDINFEVYDYEKEAVKKRKRLNNISRAADIANQMKGQDIYDFARVLGIPVTNSRLIIEGNIADYAANNPDDFLEKWDDSNRKLFSMFKRSLEVGVITHDPLKGFFYNGIFLGDNEPAVINFFTKNHQITLAIDSAAKLKDKLYNESEDTNEPLVQNKSDETEQLNKNQLQEMFNMMKKQNETIEKLVEENSQLKALYVPPIAQGSDGKTLADNITADLENLPPIELEELDNNSKRTKKK